MLRCQYSATLCRTVLLLISLYCIGHCSSFIDPVTDSAKIKQSNSCTNDEIEKNIQCFQEVPETSYEVAEGSTATLRCTVRNQHGKVQWRAVPVLLGYDRNIPGRPRFRYVGSVVKGEHHLEIRDVKKEDAKVYECQVQPVGEQHPLLRRQTILIVLVRPTEPVIFYRGVNPEKDIVIMNSLNQESASTFTCVSKNGTPASTFKWFINNDVIEQNIKIFNETKSQLIFPSKNLKDGDVIKCRVSNRATERHHDPAKQFMDKDVVIVLHSPPGQPTIEEITQPQGGAFLEGDIIRGTCKSTPPGKPAGTIVWRWKLPQVRQLYNNQREDFTVKDISPQYYQQVISSSQLTSRIELPPLSSQFHGAQLLCVAINPVTSYQSSLVNILIKYPPSEVKISASDGSLKVMQIGTDGLTETVIFGKSGEQKSITCTTEKFYSEAVIKWQIHHSPSVDDLYPKKMSFSPIEKIVKEGNSFRRNSTIKIKFEKSFDKSYLDCQAWSEGKRVDSRVKLDITYPPERPVITGYNSDSPVKLSHVIELTCSTIGGNPFPELQWLRDNKPIESAYVSQQIGGQKFLKLKIIPSKSDNNAKYNCQAKSIAMKNNPLKSKDFRLVVLFPPMEINLFSLSRTVVEDGDLLTLQCLASESNPPAVIRWKMNRCGQMMMELGHRMVQKNCEEEIIQSAAPTLLPGSYGGKKVKSNIEIRTTWKDHMDYVDCEVYNPDYITDRQALSKRIQLNVTFSPKFEGILYQNIVIEENGSKTFNIEPIANPRVLRYNWLKNSEEFGPSIKSVTVKDSQFIIQKASPSDMGNYTLIAKNDRGESHISIYLNVTYRPIILGNVIEVVEGNEQNANLECNSRANPANANQAYRWSKLVPARGFNDISQSDLVEEFSIGCNESISFEKAKWKGTPEKSNFKYFTKCNTESQFEMKSSLMVYHVDRNDVGIYKCVVNNGIGGAVTKTFELKRSFTPQILVLPNYAKAAGSQGDTVTLTCYMRAEPMPNMSWYFGKYNFSIKANSKYRLNVLRIRPGLYMAQMILIGIQRSDHGRYFCKAENDKGSDTKFIDVSGTGTPEIPLDIQIINTTTNTITISWTQGFNGGSSQTFQVRWKENRQNSLYRYEDVASDDSKLTLDFIITGLKTGTNYLVDINSRNPKHGKSAFSKYISISTLTPPNEIDHTQGGLRTITDESKLQDNTVLFIVAASVFGFVILVVNVLVIIFVLRRRRQRSRTAKLEARFNNPKSLLAASNGLVLSRDDNMRDSNSNFLRGDAVELYPRGLDSSQMSHHAHHLHSLRRSIPDDQKTFSSFETGSDDAREDLIRRQKEFGCCGVDPNSQKGSIILTYDPITNASYYTPIGPNSSAPIYLQNGMYDQDTLSTLLSPIHEGGQRPVIPFMNMLPFNRNSSSCGSINSGGVNSTGPHPPGHYIGNNISPCGSIIVTDRTSNNYTPDGINNHSSFMNGTVERQNNQTLSPSSSSVNNNAPFRGRVVSPSFPCYGMTPQQRDSYANELRKVQMSGNIVVSPNMFNRSSTTNPQILINSGSLLSSPLNHHGGQFIQTSFDTLSQPSNTLSNRGTNERNSETQLNSPTVDNQFYQKYRCTDNQIHSTQPTQIVDNSIEYVNSAMEDSTHQDISKGQDSQYLPRPNLI